MLIGYVRLMSGTYSDRYGKGVEIVKLCAGNGTCEDIDQHTGSSHEGIRWFTYITGKHY